MFVSSINSDRHGDCGAVSYGRLPIPEVLFQTLYWRFISTVIFAKLRPATVR
jgi:hypothetical protein